MFALVFVLIMELPEPASVSSGIYFSYQVFFLFCLVFYFWRAPAWLMTSGISWSVKSPLVSEWVEVENDAVSPCRSITHNTPLQTMTLKRFVFCTWLQRDLIYGISITFIRDNCGEKPSALNRRLLILSAPQEESELFPTTVTRREVGVLII